MLLALESIIYGEVAEEDIINVADIVVLVNYILGVIPTTPEIITANDYNNDGLLNVSDILILVLIILDPGQ